MKPGLISCSWSYRFSVSKLNPTIHLTNEKLQTKLFLVSILSASVHSWSTTNYRYPYTGRQKSWALHTENHLLCFHWRFHKGPRCHPSTVHPPAGKASVLLCRRGSAIQSVSSLAEIQRRVSLFQITLGRKNTDCWKAKETCLKFTFCFLSFHWCWFKSLLCKFFLLRSYLPLNIDFSVNIILIQT